MKTLLPPNKLLIEVAKIVSATATALASTQVPGTATTTKKEAVANVVAIGIIKSKNPNEQMANNRTKTSMDNYISLSVMIINKGKNQLLNDSKNDDQKEGKNNNVMFKCIIFLLFNLLLINYFLQTSR